MAASIKMTTFWGKAPFNLVEADQYLKGKHCLHHYGDECPDDGDRTHL
jgi:hypothetical protein